MRITCFSDESVEEKAKALANDPADYFNYSYTLMHSIDRNELETLQLAGLKYRFNEFSKSVKMVTKLAEKQRICEIKKIEDVIPLLFEHTMYKSYPVSLLENSQFDQLTKWLSKLTAHDLSHLDCSKSEGISDWIKLLEKESELKINTSSGTSGTMSFNPFSKAEYQTWGKMWPVCFFQKFGDPIPENNSYIPQVHAVMPTHRDGAKAFIRANDIVVDNICGSEAKLHTLYKGRLDEDMMFLAARIRSAKQKGTLDRLKINDHLLARQKEFEEEQKSMPLDVKNYLEKITGELKGERVFLLTVWNILYDLAKQALDKGIRGVFSNDSVIVCGGGAKGLEQPDDWEQVICEFTGVPTLVELYSMSELCTSHMRCNQNHFHLQPTTINFLLDSDTSEVLPRTGTVTGRYAVFDLVPNSRWGGFISGDEITINWDGECPCGAISAYVQKPINRISELKGGDDKIECAATPEAHQEAMDFLLEF